ncbi:hypothetical protein ACUSMN_004848 [Escherichia coli]
MTVPSLNKLAEMFRKEYAVVSLKFVKSQLQHPDHPHANANAKALLEKAGFIRGRHINLPEPKNPCGTTSCICYWNKAYFDGEEPAYEIMNEMANKKLKDLPAALEPDPVATTAVAVKATESTEPADPERFAVDEDGYLDPAFAESLSWKIPANPVEICEAFHPMLEENIKTYLRTLAPSHQRAFCYLYESSFQDLQGNCTLTDFDGTKHVFQTVPLSEDARRHYAALINMFYQEEKFWGRLIIWLEHHCKFCGESWEPLLQYPYSEALLSSYFYLTDLRQLYKDKHYLLQAALGLL